MHTILKNEESFFGRGGGRGMGNTASFSPHSGLLTHMIYSIEQKYSFSGNLSEKDEMF